MGKYKNTAPGGRGFSAGGKQYEADAGGIIDVPDADLKAARQEAVVDGMFGEGGFMPVGAETKAEPKTKGDAK